MCECTVIIVAFNCWDHLFRCLDALDRQTCGDFRVIVVNNGECSPEQRELLRRYSWLSFIQNSANLGFAAGNNLGIKNAVGCKWIALLNPDTIPEPDWMEKMLLAAERYPEYAMLGSLLLQADAPRLLDGAGDFYHVSGLARRSGSGMPAEGKQNKPWEAFSPCAAAAFYRSEVLKTVHGLDDDFFCYLEDVDLGFRLRLAGHQCLIVPDARVLHVGSAITGKRSDFYVYQGQRNLIWVFVKNMPGILFWLFLPLHVILNILGVLKYLSKGRSRIVLRAKYDAVAALPAVWRKRRKVQAGKIAGILDILRALDKRLV